MNELVKWQQKIDGYLRQWMHQLATVERVCGIKNGPIAKEAGNYDRNGMRGVNLAALLRGIEAVASTETALEKWDTAGFTAWGKHQERIGRYIETKPGAKAKTRKTRTPKPPAPKPVAPVVLKKPNGGKSVSTVELSGPRTEAKKEPELVAVSPVVPDVVEVSEPPKPERPIVETEPKKETPKPKRQRVARKLLSWLPWNR